MLEQYFLRPDTVDRIRSCWIGDAIERYVCWLSEHAYRARCVVHRVPILVRFGEFARQRGAARIDVLNHYVDAFAQSRIRRRARPCPSLTARQQYIRDIRHPIEQFLRVTRAGAARSGSDTSCPFARWAPGFFGHLREERGLSATKRRWIRLFDAFARRINPWLSVILKHNFGSYYWCIDACEVSTDLMWRDRPSLLGILDDLFDYALRAFSADDVVRFLGLKCRPHTAELETRHARRPEGRRIKHRVRQNWLKLYDKWSVLRIETVINNPRDFRVLRFQSDRRGRRRGSWMRMNKGICNLWRYVQIGEATNRRYLDALADVRPTGPAIAQLDSLCRQRRHQGRRYARFNPVTRHDAELFQAVLDGAHLIGGIANRDLQQQLWTAPATAPAEARRRCQRVSRLIRKLRGHAILAKIPGRRRYGVTLHGRRLLAAAIHYRKRDFPEALAA